MHRRDGPDGRKAYRNACRVQSLCFLRHSGEKRAAAGRAAIPVGKRRMQGIATGGRRRGAARHPGSRGGKRPDARHRERGGRRLPEGRPGCGRMALSPSSLRGAGYSVSVSMADRYRHRRAHRPPSGRLCRLSSPPLRQAMLQAMLRPRPLPPVWGLRASSRRKKGSKTCSSMSGGMPGPSSSTSICRISSFSRSWMRTLPE